MTTYGSERLKESWPLASRWAAYLLRRDAPPLWMILVASFWNASKIATAASAADVIANALVVAFVVLPSASSSSVTVRTLLSSPAISTIPLALSVIGPNESMDMIIPVRESIDIVATAVL